MPAIRRHQPVRAPAGVGVPQAEVLLPRLGAPPRGEDNHSVILYAEKSVVVVGGRKRGRLSASSTTTRGRT